MTRLNLLASCACHCRPVATAASALGFFLFLRVIVAGALHLRARSGAGGQQRNREGLASRLSRLCLLRLCFANSFVSPRWSASRAELSIAVSQVTQMSNAFRHVSN